MPLQTLFGASNPRSRRTDETYQMYLKDIFDAYRSALGVLAQGQSWAAIQACSRQQDALALCDALERAVHLYLEGNAAAAQSAVTSAMTLMAPELITLISKDGPEPAVDWLYRVRTFDNLAVKTKSELFHIPFELRHKVTAQRFSIPGIPCLYLGATTYVCWEELGRPQIENLVVMGCKSKANARVLNLGYPPSYLAIISQGGIGIAKNPLSEFLVAAALCLPITIAVHIKKSEKKEANFIEEYILPQLVFQWVRDSTDCVGIRYYSTNVTPGSSPHLCANYAYPTKGYQTSGYCGSLAALWEYTEPLHLALRRAVTWTNQPSRLTGQVMVVRGAPCHYNLTQFHEFDGIVRGMSAGPL